MSDSARQVLINLSVKPEGRESIRVPTAVQKRFSARFSAAGPYSLKGEPTQAASANGVNAAHFLIGASHRPHAPPKF